MVFTLKDNTIINYKVTKVYSKIHDDGVSILDKKINRQISFKLKKLIISKKIENYQCLILKRFILNRIILI